MENNNLYSKVYNLDNLLIAWRNARRSKTKKYYVFKFELNLIDNLLKLQKELENQTYQPKPLKTFILRDPKTRKISKSDFRDRVVHHALIKVIEPIFDNTFIYDSCANRKGKGNLFAIKRFDLFSRKVTRNNTKNAFCLKVDIKHYFDMVDHEILIDVIKRRIKDEKIIWVIKQILNNFNAKIECKGMPLGNLTSQFFANIYLNELDYFIKHKLRSRYYIRYVDDFVLLNSSKEQLLIWKFEINRFLNNKLKLELHPDKSKIIQISRGIDFVGFRNFYHHKLLRKRNVGKVLYKINMHKKGEISKEKILEIFQGWNAYAKWANSYKLRNEIAKIINADTPDNS